MEHGPVSQPEQAATSEPGRGRNSEAATGNRVEGQPQPKRVTDARWRAQQSGANVAGGPGWGLVVASGDGERACYRHTLRLAPSPSWMLLPIRSTSERPEDDVD